MTALHPEIEPYDSGMLEVGEGNSIYWETSGNPDGKPAIVLHGGPGSGSAPWFRRLFDPTAYRIVLFDQRNCGRSLPHASDPTTDLASNTTANLIDDIELVRSRLRIEQWLVLGGSWGSTLALAYAEKHPRQVSELILFGVTTGRHSEFDWTFRGGLAQFFPEQWERLKGGLSTAEQAGDVVEAYHRLLEDPDPAIRQQAVHAWCLWESATPGWPPSDELAPRFQTAEYAFAFARIVTHYVRNNAWLEDGELLREATAVASTPGVLINGRFDFQAPLDNAWQLKRVWPQAELIVVDDAGHSPTDSVERELVKATNRFATYP